MNWEENSDYETGSEKDLFEDNSFEEDSYDDESAPETNAAFSAQNPDEFDNRDFVTDLFDPENGEEDGEDADGDPGDETDGPTDDEDVEYSEGERGTLEIGAAEERLNYDDPMSLLVADMKRYKRLTPEEEIELARKVQNGTEEEKKAAKEQLVNSNLRLILSIAKKKFVNKGLSIEDLVSAGAEGLGKAIEKFDPDKGCRLSTFAAYDIRKAMIRAIISMSRTIKIPEDVYFKLGRIREAEELFKKEHGRAPTAQEISKSTKINVKEVKELVSYRETQVVSLEAPLDEEGKVNELDRVASTDNPLRLLNAEDIVRKHLAALDERSRKIVIGYYGFFGGKKRTDEDLAKEIGVKKQRVNQIRKAAMRKLKANGLEDELLTLNEF